MAELMLVNPRKRRRTRRNARRMTAKQRAYFGPRRNRKRAVAANPRRRRRVRRNYIRQASRPTRSNPRRRSRSRRVRRNPLRLPSVKGIIGGTLLPAAMGAAGALALDVLYAYLPIPPQYKSGTFAAPVKIAAILGLGMLAEKTRVLPSKLVRTAVAASITIQAYNFFKSQVGGMLPGVNLGAYVDGIGYTGAGQFLPDYSGMSGVGAYVSGADSNVGWSNAELGDTVF